MNKYMIAVLAAFGCMATTQAYTSYDYYPRYRTVVYEDAPVVYRDRPVVYEQVVQEVPVVVRPARRYYRPCRRYYPRYYSRPSFGGGMSFSFGF